MSVGTISVSNGSFMIEVDGVRLENVVQHLEGLQVFTVPPLQRALDTKKPKCWPV